MLKQKQTNFAGGEKDVIGVAVSSMEYENAEFDFGQKKEKNPELPMMSMRLD